MPKTVYQKSLELIQKLKKAGYTKASLPELKKAIIRFQGGDPRTIQNYIEVMKKTRLIVITKFEQGSPIFRLVDKSPPDKNTKLTKYSEEK